MKTCPNGGKNSYSEKEAKRMRNLISKNRHSLKTYRCPYCFNWHLTKDRKAY